MNLIIKVTDIVVFLDVKVFNSENSDMSFCIKYAQVNFEEKPWLEIDQFSK